MENPIDNGSKITLLAGGVGAARFLRGLVRVVDPRNITVIVNTGDDEEFYGLSVSPDIDTIIYTLAGLAPLERGWGIDGDTFHTKAALDRLYGESWFALGDRDLATHIFRTQELARGRTLTECTEDLCRHHAVGCRVVPVTNDRLRTLVDTDAGTLGFQEYLVKRRARPLVRDIRFDGGGDARLSPGVVEAITGADLVIIAPSNPLVSLGPMLAVTGLTEALRESAPSVVAISPLIGNKAVKGPLVRMLTALGYRSDNSAIASFYAGIASTLVINRGDQRPEVTGLNLLEGDTLIIDPDAAQILAGEILEKCLKQGEPRR